ncbi:uncharacterized protein N7469_009758 [Penicillium citrinum]|uniref:Uncharacterized protein n=1 Tax=Penicillium citrinum TaxID=5077 RepID=A0A9W9NJA6_PENCI|nr:uncharacterized protein N7469_009758 [Penicillium citrinum]KAJ5220871.1 hypothetical protein N7469_009758 [Penicillium citrinum]
MVLLENPKSTSATSEAKGESHKYDSLKVYREGPNTESGELDPKSDSTEVKTHNKSVADRNDSH